MTSFLRRLLDRAKSAVSSLAIGYAERAGIAVLFVLAGAFAIAAIAAMLVDRYGHVKAYWYMAAGLVAIGAIAGWGIALKEHQEEDREQEALKKATAMATQEAVQQVPIVLAASALSTPGGASSAFALARFLVRNWPLVVLLGLATGLVWPGDEEEAPFPHGNAGRLPYGAQGRRLH
jgi:MFS family permease